MFMTRTSATYAAIVALEIELKRVVQQRLHAMRAAHVRKVVSIRQLMSAYVSIRQRTPAYVSVRRRTSVYVSVPACQARRTCAQSPPHPHAACATRTPLRALPSSAATARLCRAIFRGTCGALARRSYVFARAPPALHTLCTSDGSRGVQHRAWPAGKILPYVLPSLDARAPPRSGRVLPRDARGPSTPRKSFLLHPLQNRARGTCCLLRQHLQHLQHPRAPCYLDPRASTTPARGSRSPLWR